MEERLLAPPISPIHFSQLNLLLAPITASGEAVILVYENIIRGHHVYIDIWTPMTGEILEVQRETTTNELCAYWSLIWSSATFPENKNILWSYWKKKAR
jgi:hypothetical protein